MGVMRFTQSSRWNSMDVVLCLALAYKFHGTVQAVRDVARSMRPSAPYEHRPKLKLLAEYPKDENVLSALWQMIDRTAALFDGQEDRYPAPRCHMSPMVVHRHLWCCQHCKHTKERQL